jgi:soluble lytic murein transglycosylase
MLKKMIILFLSINLTLIFSITFSALPPNLNAQEQLFLKAEQALMNGDMAIFSTLRAKLNNYPLYPYLVYDDLLLKLKTLPKKEVDAFLQNYAQSLLAEDLRTAWLRELAKQKKWQWYLDYYKDSKNIQLQCYYAAALLQLGASEKAYQRARSLWLSGYSRPNACDSVFAAWMKTGALTNTLVWQRIALAMDKGNTTLVQYLLRFLPSAEKKTVLIWLKVKNNSDVVLNQELFKQKTPQQLEIIIDGVMRRANKNAESARKIWLDVEKRYLFSPAQRQYAIRSIAIGFAKQHHSDAQIWLDLVADKYRSQEVREWQIRHALWQQNWQRAFNLIAALPAAEKNTQMWRYWFARGLQALGQTQQAQLIFTELTNHNSYYGILAHWRLGTAVQFNHASLTAQIQDIEKVNHIPAIERARELFRLNRFRQARREWQFGIRNLNQAQLEAAAVIAGNWGWPDRSIQTAANASSEFDFKISYPFAYTDIVEQSATLYNLNPAWLYAVIRQESLFMQDVGSHAGAQGLMQLMPATAKYIASAAQVDLSNKWALLEAKKNIKLGAHYLRMMLDRNGGNSILATAAYNAGPGNVGKWLPDTSMPADIWIENIPFQETQHYEKQVLLNLLAYSNRLRQTDNFDSRLANIPTGAQIEQAKR